MFRFFRKRSEKLSFEQLRSVSSPGKLRQVFRRRQYAGPTAGLAPGYVQANLVVLPKALAADFEQFCRLNAQACPLLEVTDPGDPEPKQSAPGADLRHDLPRYRVYRRGVQVAETLEITPWWQEDLVAFLLGCSFTFERALAQAGLVPRHVELGRNVPMYRTNRPCQPAGPFQGPLVVSMRPYRPEQLEQVQQITACYPRMHGAPIHVGDPDALGIEDLSRPDYGQPVPLEEGEVPVFWACGVTPQAVVEQARCELAITHSPGCMFITDWRDEEFYEPPGQANDH